MNIFQRLKQDHDKQRELAAELLETVGDSAQRHQLWQAFKPEAVAHAAAEEQTLYATLIEIPDGQVKARHSVSEHKEAADLIKDLSETDMTSSGWIRKFAKLKEELDHHMKEEENEIFLTARDLIDDETARDLTHKFEARKQAELEI